MTYGDVARVQTTDGPLIVMALRETVPSDYDHPKLPMGMTLRGDVLVVVLVVGGRIPWRNGLIVPGTIGPAKADQLEWL